jgi:hypothetical protein
MRFADNRSFAPAASKAPRLRRSRRGLARTRQETLKR